MKMFKCLLVISCLASVCLAHSASAAQSINSNTIDDGQQDGQQQTPRSGSYLGEIKYLYKTYQDCASSDVSTCLKLKLFTILDRVARSLKDFKISEGIKFVRDQEVPIDSTPVKSEAQLETELPRSMDEKERSLNSMLFDKVLSFFQTHTLQVKFPSSEEIKRSMEEVRGQGGFGGGSGGLGGKDKDKKNGHWIMIPLLLGSTLVPLAFGALALLAGKALIVSKLALALASIIGIKKLISSGGGHHESAHEVVVSGGHGGGWGRIGNAQGLAYNGYGHYAQ
ncbi:Osiris [Culex quinquefasciatus]|uniref:Osiris n=1 Tax=Culex quinquefasciatus TaxID=7176 RepID=B0WLV9_CULQU|nr:Osiris [Culex quinquefasciatus]|eukprot:XP_001849693.1 Osiris [Culex quinquefasciatus]